MKYYILSTNHTRSKDFVFTWWRPDNSGYTYAVESAGVYDDENHYSKESGDIMIPCDIIDSLKEKRYYPLDHVFNIVINNRSNRIKMGIKLKCLYKDNYGVKENSFLKYDYVKGQYERFKRILKMFD